MHLKELSKLFFFLSFSFLTLMILFCTFQYFVTWLQCWVSLYSFYCIIKAFILAFLVNSLRKHILDSVFFSNVCPARFEKVPMLSLILWCDILLEKDWLCNFWLIVSDTDILECIKECVLKWMYAWINHCR